MNPLRPSLRGTVAPLNPQPHTRNQPIALDGRTNTLSNPGPQPTHDPALQALNEACPGTLSLYPETKSKPQIDLVLASLHPGPSRVWFRRIGRILLQAHRLWDPPFGFAILGFKIKGLGLRD